MSGTNFRHDHHFKRFYQNRLLALEHVEDYMPAHLLKELNLETFAIDQNTYVSPTSETRSDLVYGCNLHSGDPLRVALLHEHKSKQPERDVRFQFHDYENGIWRLDELHGLRSTFVLPWVIYHGIKDWVKMPFREAFPNLPKSMRAFLPERDYLLTNLRALTDEEIRQRSGMKMVASALLVLRHAFEPDFLKLNFAKIVNFDWQGYERLVRETFVKDLLNYLASLTKFTRKEFEKAAMPLPPELNYFAMMTMQSILDEGIEIGYKKGRETGRQEGHQEGRHEEALRKQREFVISLLTNCPHWADEKIALLVGTDKKFVAQVRSELFPKPNGKSKK